MRTELALSEKSGEVSELRRELQAKRLEVASLADEAERRRREEAALGEREGERAAEVRSLLSGCRDLEGRLSEATTRAKSLAVRHLASFANGNWQVER